jgi:hypothetical protein
MAPLSQNRKDPSGKRGRPKLVEIPEFDLIFAQAGHAQATLTAYKSHIRKFGEYIWNRGMTLEKNVKIPIIVLRDWLLEAAYSEVGIQTVRDYQSTVRVYGTYQNIFSAAEILVQWPHAWNVVKRATKKHTPNQAVIITKARFATMTKRTRNIVLFMLTTATRWSTARMLSKADIIKRTNKRTFIQARSIKYLDDSEDKILEIGCNCRYTAAGKSHNFCLQHNPDYDEIPDIKAQASEFQEEMKVLKIGLHSPRVTAAYAARAEMNLENKVHTTAMANLFGWTVASGRKMLQYYTREQEKIDVTKLVPIRATMRHAILQ